MQQKHGRDELKPENQLISPKVPPPYDPELLFGWERASTHITSTYKPLNILHPNTKFVGSGVKFIKNESFFYHGTCSRHTFEVFHR